MVTDQGEGWSYLAVLEKGKMNSRLYAPYGPVADSAAALAAALSSMRSHAKRLGASFLRVEPTGEGAGANLPALGLRRSKSNQPEHTHRINVDRPFEQVLTEMTKTLRNLHRNYAKKGLSVRRSEDPRDIEHLLRLLGDVSERTGIRAHEADYFRAQASTLVPNDAAIYLVEFEGEVIAAALIYVDAERSYYAHAAAATEHRRLHAGSILLAQVLQDASEGPQREVDLFGVVPPEIENHPWSGFSRFKRSFGGHQFDYAGTWELPVRAASYAAYSLARRVLGERVR